MLENLPGDLSSSMEGLLSNAVESLFGDSAFVLFI